MLTCARLLTSPDLYCSKGTDHLPEAASVAGLRKLMAQDALAAVAALLLVRSSRSSASAPPSPPSGMNRTAQS
jgi:hypothetical protein